MYQGQDQYGQQYGGPYGQPQYGQQSYGSDYGHAAEGRASGMPYAGSPGPILHHPQPTHPIPPMRSPPADASPRGYAAAGGGAPNMGRQPGQYEFFGMDTATAQMGYQVGRHAFTAGQDFVEQNVSKWFSVQALRYYFNVSNSYVVHKLRVILFPWTHKPWSRGIKRSEVNGAMEGYKPPREDVNAPDMYIPLMAFVTYILLAALLAGLHGEFRPEMLGITASYACGVVIFEFLVILVGSYLLSIQGESQVLDLLSYCGYKFVGIIVCKLSKLFERRWLFYLTFTYTFMATAFFFLRSLRYMIIPDATSGMASTTTGHTPGRNRRVYFLFGISMAQAIFMWALS